MSQFSLQCSSCEESSPLPTSSGVTQRGKSYDINRRVVYHAIESGSGYEGLATFCGIMNMPCLSKPAYYKQVDNILEALEDEAKEDMRKAGEKSIFFKKIFQLFMTCYSGNQAPNGQDLTRDTLFSLI